jgi:hypothetical protein
LDLEGLRNTFQTGSIRVRQIEVPNSGAITALLADEFTSLTSGVEVQERAQRLVACLSGALLALGARRSAVGIGPVYEKADVDAWGAGTNYASAVIEVSLGVRANAHVVGPDGLPKPETQQKPRLSLWLALVDAADSEPDPVTDVLHALSRDLDWFDLWRAYELIRSERHRLNWPRDQVDRFRQAATRHRHSASNAKEWLEERGEPEIKPEMRLSEARELITSLARAWLDWKVETALFGKAAASCVSDEPAS